MELYMLRGPNGLYLTNYHQSRRRPWTKRGTAFRRLSDLKRSFVVRGKRRHRRGYETKWEHCELIKLHVTGITIGEDKKPQTRTYEYRTWFTSSAEMRSFLDLTPVGCSSVAQARILVFDVTADKKLKNSLFLCGKVAYAIKTSKELSYVDSKMGFKFYELTDPDVIVWHEGD